MATLRGLPLFRSCPDPWRITRASLEGPDLKLARHLAACGRCSAELAALRALVDKATTLPGEGLPDDARERIAARLMASEAPPVRRPLPRALLAAAAAGGVFAAAAAVAVLAGWPRAGSVGARAPHPSPVAVAPPARPASASAAAIRAFGAARFSRKQGPPDEIVELAAGTIDVDVEPLAAGARFRVLALGDEVEVRGTNFRVSAEAGRLAEVRVWRGHVEVRAAGGAVTKLGPGEAWSRDAWSRDAWSRDAWSRDAWTNDAGPSDAWAAAPVPKPRVAQTPAAERPRARARLQATAPPEAPAPPSPPAPSFHRAWVLLRGGDAIAAAEAFAEVQDASRGTSLEADALYWRAVALSRGGERRAARDLFDLFLRRFPGSSRAGEAAVALGFLLVDLGQPAEARQAFARAQTDPSERVRASARLGLDRAAASSTR